MSSLASTTAPGKKFHSRAELAAHYKSDWHMYNVKRREAGLALLVEEDFTARREAASALRQEERGSKNEQKGTSHLKEGKKTRKNKKKNNKEEAVEGGVATVVSQATAWWYDKIKNGMGGEEKKEEKVEQDKEEPPVIEPRQCLFDKHMSPSLQANVARMHRKYGFFIPDVEYLDDLEGFIGYCHEKVKLGHCCLYCQRTFSTWTGCQKHMIMKRHTKLRYERGVDLAEFDPFYDFNAVNKEHIGNFLSKNAQYLEEDAQPVHGEDDDIGTSLFQKVLSAIYDEHEDDHLEDITDDESEDEEMDDAADVAAEDNDDLYAGYKEDISHYGFNVSPIGELVFPDGRIVGHRGLQRYYKQRAQPSAYDNDSATTALQLTRSGVTDRAGDGILVGGSESGTFTALSLYRYRAVVKKARQERATGQRHADKGRFRGNTNKMDKKHNRVMNGVSVAHTVR